MSLGTGFRVLIVDQDTTFIRFLCAILVDLDVHDILRSNSNAEAWGLFSSLDKPVDCILCEDAMPSGNGLHLLRAVRLGRARRVRPDACFVLTTATGNTEIVDIAKRLDVSGYLVKPPSPGGLRETILRARRRIFRIDLERYTQVAVPDLSDSGMS